MGCGILRAGVSQRAVWPVVPFAEGWSCGAMRYFGSRCLQFRERFPPRCPAFRRRRFTTSLARALGSVTERVPPPSFQRPSSAHSMTALARCRAAGPLCGSPRWRAGAPAAALWALQRASGRRLAAPKPLARVDSFRWHTSNRLDFRRPFLCFGLVCYRVCVLLLLSLPRLYERPHLRCA